MERNLVWSSLAIGFACWLAAFALTRKRRFALAGIDAALPLTFFGAAVLLPVVLFVATMPSHGKFFAPGHDLGNGFLLGAIGAILSSVLLIQHLLASDGEIGSLRTAAVTASPFALGVAASAAPLIIRHDTLSIALLGVAIGWLAASAILLLGLKNGDRANVAGSAVPAAIVAGTCFVALLCTTITLGDLHGAVTFIKASTAISYGVVALVFASGIPLFLILGAVADMIFNPEVRDPKNANFAAIAGRARFARAAIVVAGSGVLARMLCNRIIDADEQASPSKNLPHLIEVLISASKPFHVMGIGLLLGLLIWWISAAAQNRNLESSETGPNAGPLVQNNVLGILVVLAGVMAAYQMLAGFGVGLMLLAVSPVVGLSLIRSLEPSGHDGEEQEAISAPADTAMRLVQLAGLGAVFTLFRVYTTMNDGLSPRNPYTDQYAVFGFVAGLVVPLFLANYLFTKAASNSGSPYASLIRLCVSGALLLGMPSLMLMLWGEKCVMAFLTALAIAATGIGAAGDGSVTQTVANSIRKLFAAIYALGIALALCEWSHYLLDNEDWTRIQKERMIVQIVGVLILLVVAADYRTYQWIAGWVRRDQTGSTKGSVR